MVEEISALISAVISDNQREHIPYLFSSQMHADLRSQISHEEELYKYKNNSGIVHPAFIDKS
jgi:hypothetical protein